MGTFDFLPSESLLLDFYLHIPDQDPEWVYFVYERIITSPPGELEARFQSFLNIEFSSSTRDMIISLYKTLFYGREDPLLFIPSNDLDLLLRSALESYELNQTALSDILQSLCQERHESPFYSGLMEAKADAFHQLWDQHHNTEIESNRRTQAHLEGLRLEEIIRGLQEKRSAILF